MFYYSNFKASPDLDLNFPHKLLILAFLANFWWFWIWIIWQRCRNGQNPKITRFSQRRQIWTWIFPKIADFGVFDQFSVKKDMKYLVTMSEHNKKPFLDDYFCSPPMSKIEPLSVFSWYLQNRHPRRHSDTHY